jgi:hypothetical protein
MPRMLPVRPRRSRTSPRTSSAPPPTRSRPRKLPPLAMNASKPAGRSASGSAQLPHEIRELVLDDQRVRNEVCWGVFAW